MLSLIPISMGFSLGYSYSHPFPKHAQRNNKVKKMQTVDSPATEKQFHRTLEISHSQYFENQTKKFYCHPS